jgi:hypothetical protein
MARHRTQTAAAISEEPRSGERGSSGLGPADGAGSRPVRGNTRDRPECRKSHASDALVQFGESPSGWSPASRVPCGPDLRMARHRTQTAGPNGKPRPMGVGRGSSWENRWRMRDAGSSSATNTAARNKFQRKAPPVRAGLRWQADAHWVGETCCTPTCLPIEEHHPKGRRCTHLDSEASAASTASRAPKPPQFGLCAMPSSSRQIMPG